MKSLTTTLLLVMIGLTSYAATPYYLSVDAKNGDGVYSLLRQYNLDLQPCNFQKFYELNDLNKNSGLKVNKSYLLPITIMTYDGKSIRSTVGINDWDIAIDIKAYNENIKDLGLRKTHYVDSKILWVPHHLVGCGDVKGTSHLATTATPKAKSETPPVNKQNKKATASVNTTAVKPSKGKTLNEPLFGDKYETVTIKNQDLKGKVYYIVAGHGGIDPGAMCTDCTHTLCEDEYAYDVSLRLSRTLMEQGATVHIIIQDTDGIRDGKYLACDTDETCLGGAKVARSQKQKLYQRTNKVNSLYAKHKAEGVKEQYAMFIHVDSNHENKRMDVYFFHHEKSKKGKKLAQNLQNTFRGKYAQHQADRGYHGDIRCRNLYVVNNTHPPAILVELGNIKNTNDQKRIMLAGNRQALADWLAEGLSTFKP